MSFEKSAPTGEVRALRYMEGEQEKEVARIQVIKRGPVGEIRLNEPEVLNAQGQHWPEDMLAAAEEVRGDPEIRLVLLTGEGRTFCSGLNLTQLGRGEISNEWFHTCEYAFRSMETMEKPTIAGLQGYCIGGGLQIAIACDVRIAADDAILGLPATREAFIPGMSTYRLPRVIGMAHARHLILSGQNIDADEAYRIGLVNKVVPRAELENELEAWAQSYLEVPLPSLVWSKRLSNSSYDLTFEQFLEEYDRAVDAVISTEEHQAARREWLELRGYDPDE
jgi:enoyl-CoA hydratase/carnithine racemase